MNDQPEGKEFHPVKKPKPALQSLECYEDIVDLENIESFVDSAILLGLLEYRKEPYEHYDPELTLPSILFVESDSTEEVQAVPGTPILDSSCSCPDSLHDEPPKCTKEDPLSGIQNNGCLVEKLSQNKNSQNEKESKPGQHGEKLSDSNLLPDLDETFSETLQPFNSEESTAGNGLNDSMPDSSPVVCSWEYNADVSSNDLCGSSPSLWSERLEQQDELLPQRYGHDDKDDAVVPQADPTPTSRNSSFSSINNDLDEAESNDNSEVSVLANIVNSSQPQTSSQIYSQESTFTQTPQSLSQIYHIYDYSFSEDSQESVSHQRDLDSCGSTSDQTVPTDPSIEE